MMSNGKLVCGLGLCGLGLALFSTLAVAGNGFCNAAPITIVDNAAADVYPSAITVSGAPGSITSVSVQINGFSHTFPDDVGMVLVGPGGQALLLQDGAGDDPDMVGVTYFFSDAAAAQLPDLTAWTAGTYKPTAYTTGDNFGAPGPGTTYASPAPSGSATLSSVYSGTSANGTWNLFVEDFVAGDSGSISGGWCISFAGTPVRLQDFSVD